MKGAELTLNRPLEGREGDLDGITTVVGGVPGVTVLSDEVGAGLGQEGALSAVVSDRCLAASERIRTSV